MYPPEFTVTCQTQGGPAENIHWLINENEILTNVSQIIISTAQDSVYDNKLHMRGRINGSYVCVIANEYPSSSLHSITIAGNYTLVLWLFLND